MPNDNVIVMFPSANPWVNDPGHVGEMTVRQLVGLVMTDEFPKGLDTRIMVGDVEGNEGTNGTFCVTAHKPGDVVLSIDMHCGDEYDPDDDASAEDGA
jgi:hypothetical protein